MGSSAYCNKCVTFDGDNEYATASGTSALSKEYNQPFSVSFWAASEDPGGYLFGKMDATTNYRGWGVYRAGLMLRNTQTQYMLAGFTNLTSAWTHRVITYDGSGVPAGVKCFENGSEISQTTSNNTLGGNTLINAVSFWLGGAVHAVPGWIQAANIAQVS